MGQEFRLPRHVVDIVLDDSKVRHGRCEMRADDVAEQPAAVVMRRDIDLVGLGEVGHLHRLEVAVPRHVDDRHIGGPGLEERPKGAARIEILA